MSVISCEKPTHADARASAGSSTPSNRISSAILFGTVALAPLPFGSTDPATIAFWCIVLGVALVFASPRQLRRPHFAILGGVAVIILAYAFVLHEQLSPHPWVASPHPLWREASEVLGTELEPSVSIARNQPFFALGASLVAILALICGLIVCAHRDRAHQLLKVIAWSGVAYAVYGIAAFLIDPTNTLWRESAYPTVLTSTFINRNTAAAYFGSCAVVWLVLLSESVGRQVPSDGIRWKELLNHLVSAMPREIVVSFSMVLICLAAMFMTVSRAGVVLALVSLVVASSAYFSRYLHRRGSLLVAVMVSGAMVLVLLQILGAGVSGRFDRQGLGDGGRLETYRATLRMIADHPWFGTGLGTFAWSFPAYRSANISMWGVWDRAHNTLLELASDLGVPLAGLVVAAWIIALSVLVRGIRIRRRNLSIPVAALSVSVLALLHSLVDFSLQIPGYTIVVFAVVGAGLSHSFRSIEQ